MNISLTTSISCSFYNDKTYPLIIRVVNIAHRHFERTVLPQQMLRFETLSNAILEIRSPKIASTIHADQIPCSRLETIPQ
ncbi:DUF1830 domain-containing protein (plasmid) [Acaryochloris sp. 'Moss Beach']|uniref:DUF1830 domain-containing protein n=1 Tax=Acaryochloris sp. 'Moss Beach' TaxID=2740837 RepID=UPI001F2554FA|nr:DUF1830 domain-containing protein [Acaryochloris sp. 'Moss Beach']UJB72815.1 DUF1830 domain-containing protein [Acaryochloris sp. 'Moss Beach']